MNKQEVIEEIKNLEGLTILDKTINFDSEMIPKKEVFNIINQIDEPEKPVLTKEEAEWVDKLTDVYDVPDALYYITRCGYGYGLTFEICGKTYELSLEDGITYGELYKLKERLVNAVLYSYEVDKVKYYEVYQKRTGAQLGVCEHGEDKKWFTDEELEVYGFNNLDEYGVEEVDV
ncbi:hypothetical protein SAMN05216470_2048 [Streptococcus equinus]|uniref:DUF1642 domain-containing protein n=1 Tax=Streptococcus equinus TaxID=1335 RepID=A0A239RG40_STREI|nr:hypothetical protein [Streptococcus equinus]SNU09832.1 hypothetical protein SAMN05216470_2048 [Streptococcus equinus]